MTFYGEPVVRGEVTRHMIRHARGELVWIRCGEKAESLSPTVHPALIVHTVDAGIAIDRVELVPHLPAHDPLLQHVVLVLKGEIEAEDVPGQVYAEVLANALAVHLLRRYAACRPIGWEVTGGLPPGKLQRTIAYIQTHLTEELSLAALAAVVRLSPDHFGRLFKQATGQTPHQYVLRCRIARARQLLTETTLSLSEISYQVGCADQSYFTALFRKYIGTTPKAYRAATQR